MERGPRFLDFHSTRTPDARTPKELCVTRFQYVNILATSTYIFLHAFYWHERRSNDMHESPLLSEIHDSVEISQETTMNAFNLVHFIVPKYLFRCFSEIRWLTKVFQYLSRLFMNLLRALRRTFRNFIGYSKTQSSRLL